jgi:hypothetical protein
MSTMPIPEEHTMYAVVRRYTASSPLADAMVAREQEIRDLISSVPGFVTYYAVRDGDILATVTVCQDKEGTDESTRRAAAWVRENMADALPSAPDVTQGNVFLNFGQS